MIFTALSFFGLFTVYLLHEEEIIYEEVLSVRLYVIVINKIHKILPKKLDFAKLTETRSKIL